MDVKNAQTYRKGIDKLPNTSISADHLKVRWLSKKNSLSMSETNSELQNMNITQYRKRQNSAKRCNRNWQLQHFCVFAENLIIYYPFWKVMVGESYSEFVVHVISTNDSLLKWKLKVSIYDYEIDISMFLKCLRYDLCWPLNTFSHSLFLNYSLNFL